MTTLTGLWIPSPEEAWAELGFSVRDGHVDVGRVRIRVGGEAPEGITQWSFDTSAAGHVDGLATTQGAVCPAGPTHPNGVDLVDHVVVGTGDMARTLTALATIGLTSRRQRIGPLRGQTVWQEFVLAGTCVIELIAPPEPDGGPATFWGLAFATTDLDATAAAMGDRLRAPRDAIQPGRRIATVRGGRRSIGLPLAVLSSRPTPR